jgi:hypothetical protein
MHCDLPVYKACLSSRQAEFFGFSGGAGFLGRGFKVVKDFNDFKVPA